mmetsp:Transcript_30309/g.55150  ORF Transcript_30309/g.55150 Transcript_30309/m.55150 type:complete len:130 (+) Transcript_30309:650-1039(+)
MQILVVDRGARRRVCVQQLACPGELQSRQMPFVPAASPEVDPAITDDGQLLATDSVSRESSSQRAWRQALLVSEAASLPPMSSTEAKTSSTEAKEQDADIMGVENSSHLRQKQQRRQKEDIVEDAMPLK